MPPPSPTTRPRRSPRSSSTTRPIVNGLATMPKPVLAAINGTCVGAGLGLALACDLRIAAAGARLATAFTAIGLTCDSGLSATLVRAVGAARASELILLGEPFTAEQAAEWGLVSRVVDRRRACCGRRRARPPGSPPDRRSPTPRRSGPSPPPSQPPLADVLAAEAAAQAPARAESRPRRRRRRLPRQAPPRVPRSVSHDGGSHEMFAADAASRALGIELVAAEAGTATLRMRVTGGDGQRPRHRPWWLRVPARRQRVRLCLQQPRPGRPWRPPPTSRSSPRRKLGDELVAVATERTRFGRSGIYDVTVFRAEGDERTVIAEFRGTSRTLDRR